VKKEPALLPQVLRETLGVRVPAFASARPYAADVKKLVSATYHADALLVYYDAANVPVQAIIFEVQREWDPDKRWTLPIYVSHAEIDTRTDCLLMLFCPNKTVADRYRTLFPSTALSAMHLWVIVYTPDDIDLVLDADEAIAAPERAIFAALCHGENLDKGVVFPVLGKVLASVDPTQATMYVNILLAGLPAAVVPDLEAYVMTTYPEIRSTVYLEGIAEGEARGEARGKAEAVLEILGLRGVRVPDETREKILSCTDPGQLTTWLRHATTARTIGDVLHPRADPRRGRRNKGTR